MTGRTRTGGWKSRYYICHIWLQPPSTPAKPEFTPSLALSLFLFPVYRVESWPRPVLDDRKRHWGCWYITVDFAMASSQNGFCIYQLSLHRQTNVITKMTKSIIFYVLWCRCRGIRRDVVYLCWPIAPPHIRVLMRGRVGVAGSQPMSSVVHITWHGAQISVGDLPPYLTYVQMDPNTTKGPSALLSFWGGGGSP